MSMGLNHTENPSEFLFLMLLKETPKLLMNLIHYHRHDPQ